MWIFLVLSFVVASYTDIKREEIPVILFPACTILCMVFYPELFFSETLLVRGAITGIVFLIYYLLARYCKGGGGDIIMMTCLAFLMSEKIIFIMLVSHILYMITILILHKKTMCFAPFAFAGYLLSIIVF